MKCLIATKGPITIYINADVIKIFDGGVILNREDNCSQVNHAVVIVGYGTDPDSNLDYW